jgi:hypothetical protein
MKKILAIGALATLTLSAFGQGQLTFNNRVLTVTPNVSAPVYIDVVGSGTNGAASGATVRAALLGGSTSGTPASASTAGTLALLVSPSTPATWATFRTGTLAGFVAVGTDSARNSGLAYGSTGLFQMVAWEGTQDTWAAAYAAWQSGQIRAGFSNPIQSAVTTGPTDLAVPALQGLNPFAIGFNVVVPEPSSFALAGLGAAALLIFRRRK